MNIYTNQGKLESVQTLQLELDDSTVFQLTPGGAGSLNVSILDNPARERSAPLTINWNIYGALHIAKVPR
jgi:hypothetical protein